MKNNQYSLLWRFLPLHMTPNTKQYKASKMPLESAYASACLHYKGDSFYCPYLSNAK